MSWWSLMAVKYNNHPPTPTKKMQQFLLQRLEASELSVIHLWLGAAEINWRSKRIPSLQILFSLENVPICPTRGIFWLHLWWFVAVVLWVCQRYTSECNCALSNRAFLPAVVHSQHLRRLVSYCFPGQLHLTNKHCCTVKAPLCLNPRRSCLIEFQCISASVLFCLKNWKDLILHFSTIIGTSWPDPPRLHKGDLCRSENTV